MRGFSFGEVNVLYNGISAGPASITTRTMDTANLSQIEFLKGPSRVDERAQYDRRLGQLRQPPTDQRLRSASELDVSIDSLGTTTRTQYGSGGSTAVKGLDYRFDVSGFRGQRLHR